MYEHIDAGAVVPGEHEAERFRMSAESMDVATTGGAAEELGATVTWARLRLGTWWTSSGECWVRADPTTAAILDSHQAKMAQADINVSARFLS